MVIEKIMEKIMEEVYIGLNYSKECCQYYIKLN